MKLAIIILSGDTPEILFRCLLGIKENVLVEYKIYLAYNGKSPEVEKEIRSFLESHFGCERYKVVKYGFYNFAALNNDVARNHLDPEAEFLLFCNNDVIISGDCVNEMVYFAAASPLPLGTLGCRLLFEDGTIQHDGQVIYVWKDGRFRRVTHINVGADSAGLDHPEPRLVIGNTFALCLSKREVFDSVGGLNEGYTQCFEDVEYNLRCLQLGFFNIVMPSHVWAYHLESYSRKKEAAEKLVKVEDAARLVNFFEKKFMNGKNLVIQTGELP